MQFTFFHLMPYRPLDMAERHKHRAGWVVLPNNLYDAKKGADEYQSYIDQLIHAERLGFDVIAVNEHHQTAYGLMPAPNLIASALIQLTKKAKIAIIGRALPLVNNPINIAEEFAMLDNLSRGRIITGFVRVASRHGNTATRLRLIRSDGPRPSMSPTATSAPAQKPRPALKRFLTISSLRRSRCCCHRATCHFRR